MRRPSVLFINRVYPPVRGATGRVLRDLAHSFVRKGWQVSVVTTGIKASKEFDNGVRVIRIKGAAKPSNVFSYCLIWLKMLVIALRLPKTHLLVTMSDPPFLLLVGQIVKRFKGCRHINWCHDLYPDIFPAINVRLPVFIMKLLRSLARNAMCNADKVIVIGRCMARRLAYDGVNSKNITMIPNWPNFELMQASVSKNSFNDIAHESLHVDGSKSYEEQLKDSPKFRVLYAGNIGLVHPIDSILDAAEILNNEQPDIEFVFVGDGARFDEIVLERSRRNLDNIRLLPFQPFSRLKELMESGDVHLISLKESASGMSVPSKLYSAFAVGRPCIFIGSAESEAAKVITDYKAGMVVPQGNPQLLAESIKQYRLSGEDWFAAHNGAMSAGKVFVPENAIDAWIERAYSIVEPDLKSV